MLEWVHEAAYGAHRILNAKSITSEILIIGPHEDSRLKEFTEKEGMSALFPKCAEDDLLTRLSLAAYQKQSDYICRLTSDCWLIHEQVIAEVIEIALKDKLDYFSNTIQRTFPEGQDCQVVSKKALQWFDAHQQENREHPFSEFDQNLILRKQFEAKGLRWKELLNPQFAFLIKGSSIDTKQDLEIARKFYAEQNPSVLRVD